MLNQNETNYLLIGSSLFFLLPCFYAWVLKVYSLCLLTAATTIISINYWRHPCLGWRRDLDLYFAKFSFCCFFCIGAMNISDSALLRILYTNIFALFIFFGLSNYMWMKSVSYMWTYFHFIFHVFVTISQILVIYGSFKKN